MTLVYVAEDLSREYIFSEIYHLAIFASGYEERSVHLATLMQKHQFSKSIVLGFADESSDVVRLENDASYRKLGYRVDVLDGDYETGIYQILRDQLQEFFTSDVALKILIDYSSMPRTWYSAILNFFRYYSVK